MRIGTRVVVALLPMAVALLLPATAWAWPRLDPGDPFTMTVDDVACRSSRATVTLRNVTRQLARYDLRADGRTVASGSIPARKTIVKQVRVKRGSRAEIEAYSVAEHQADTLIDSTDVENDCPWGHHLDRLPFTGPPVDLMAKLATAGGLVIMGGVLWWYGSIWPRSAP
ncbi:hypothetical protein E1295_07880 [Nonomuraea mesophila]|uniref:DUF3592 domain-containing protein n=1 Tax=Nonomuraea mesophila TaxID=2530382 RepID=A0A4R5FVF5_9ACTN|nr:hypothetical protein [Nonomuraea mesophila]TDE57618.1 hypothetical protein E1295_07880 [Nonomuraea mesophila]